MTRAIVHPLWGSLSLDRHGEISLQSQVVAYFRQAIIEGRLRRGLRLPSSRQLASDHGISRTTAVEAYERLIAEGYLYAQAGSGIFVSERIPEDFTPHETRRGASRSLHDPHPENSMSPVDMRSYHLPLAPGMPAVDLFPWGEWHRELSAVMRERPLNEIAHGDPMGELPLRETISDYIAAMKGIRCDPEQIVVVGGTVLIFEVAFDLLRLAGAKAIVEDPVYPFIRIMLPRLGFNLVGGPMDEHGMDVERALAAAPDAHVAFVSPSHSVPYGSSLSLERRQALVDWSDATGGWIVENEFDGDFRFASRPLPTCLSLSRTGRVLMIGSLSKPFAPGLRLGYLVLPREMLSDALLLRLPQAPVAMQLALARFGTSGALSTHLRMLRTVHEGRRALLLGALQNEARGLIELVHAPEAGLRVMTSVPDGVDDVALATACHAAGIKVEALSPSFVDRPRRPGLMIGFGSTREEEIAPAIRRIAELVHAQLAGIGTVAGAQLD